MRRLAIHLFGVAQVVHDGVAVVFTRRKTTALLAFLALSGRAIARDEAAALLWPELDQQGARKMLRQVLTELRRGLGRSWLYVHNDQIALADDPDLWVDVRHFRSLQARVAAHQHAANQLCDACVADLTEATALYVGSFMAGFALPDAADFEAWQARQADSLQQDAAAMLAQLTHAHASAGQRAYRLAIAYAARWLSLDPMNEEAHRALMRLYAQSGQRGAALHQYESCVATLAAELNVEPEDETQQLAVAIRSGIFPTAEASAPVSPTAWGGDPRPIAATPFMGRVRELAQIDARLSDPGCRLLTIVGPGGAGKTRLALQVAQAIRGRFTQGVFFVDLGSVQSNDQFVPRLVGALGVPAGAAAPERRLLDFLKHKQALLVLDSCEHLVGAIAWLSTLLHAAPGVKILATSRVRLNLRDEWLEPLEGLELPPAPSSALPALPVAPAALADYAATRLFVHCMQRLQPDAVLGEEDATAIVALCHLLAGMPLAIELAASWTHTLPLTTLRYEISTGLTLLSTSLHDMPPRHRSMMAVFDHSWQLLDERERYILRRFSAFRGGCRPDAGQALTGATLAELAALVDKSWLRAASAGRYAMHDLVRQYCTERLRQDDDAEAVYRQHAAYYGRMLLGVLNQLGYAREAVDDIVAEYGNIQAGLRWAAIAHDVTAMRAMVISLYFLAEGLGYMHEVRRLYQSAVDLLVPEVADRSDPQRWQQAALTLAWVQWPYSNLWIFDGQLERCGEMAAATRRLLDELEPSPDHTYLQAQTDWVLALYALRGGDYHEGEARLRQVLIQYQAPDFPSMFYEGHTEALDLQSDVYCFMGHGAFHRGDYDEAERLMRHGIEIRTGLGERRFNAHHAGWLVRVLQVQGRYGEAEALVHNALAGVIAAGDHISEVASRIALGRLETELGHHAAARSHFEQALAFIAPTGILHYQFDAYAGLGWVELELGNPAAARAYGDTALNLLAQAGPVHSNHLPAVFVMAGWAALAERDLPAARRHLTGALYLRGRMALDALQALAGLAHLLVAEEEPEAALALFTVVEAHAATPYGLRVETQRAIQELRASLGASLPDKPGTEVLAPDLQEVVAHLLRDPGVAPPAVSPVIPAAAG